MHSIISLVTARSQGSVWQDDLHNLEAVRKDYIVLLVTETFNTLRKESQVKVSEFSTKHGGL